MCQEELGYSPTRGLDDAGITTKEASAYLACLNLDNKPIEQLRNPCVSWKHVSASFIAIVSQMTIIKIASKTELNIVVKNISESQNALIILTGDMKQWRDAIIACCVTGDKELRELFNYCLIYFQESGFREVFHDCDKNGLEDKTFTVGLRKGFK